MQLDPRDFSSFPIVRIILVIIGCALMAYCVQYYLVLPPDSELPRVLWRQNDPRGKKNS